MSLQKSLIAKIHDIKNEKKVNLMNYMEDKSATAKDKVNLTLDVTTVIVMPAFVIKESVMCTVESAMVKCNLVSAATTAATD